MSCLHEKQTRDPATSGCCSFENRLCEPFHTTCTIKYSHKLINCLVLYSVIFIQSSVVLLDLVRSSIWFQWCLGWLSLAMFDDCLPPLFDGCWWLHPKAKINQYSIRVKSQNFIHCLHHILHGQITPVLKAPKNQTIFGLAGRIPISEVNPALWLVWYLSFKITLLRVIPTMAFIHFVTGKSSGILSDILSGILSGIPSGILSGISSGILSDVLSGISSGPGISSGILSYIPSGISSGILSGRWGPAVHTELGRSQVEVQRCTAGQVPGWGPAVHTELGRSPVEVQRCTLSWAGPRLRSSGAHWAGQLAGWGPAVHTELGSSQVEVQQCALSWEVGEDLGDELARLARRKWRWCKAEVEVEEAEARRRARRTASRGGGGGGGGGGGHALW